MPKEKTPQKNRGGRPRKKIDYAKLDSLCAIQCSGEECASVFDIDYDTLNIILKRDGHGGFSDYFALKRSFGRISLRRAQFRNATENLNPAMQKWLGKQYLGQRDQQDLNHTSEDGSMSPKPGIDTSKLSTEALAEIMALHDDQDS